MMAASVPTGGAATLSLRLNGSVANTIRIQGLVRTPSGELSPFSRNVAAPSDRVPVTTDVATDVDGDVVALTIEALTAGTKRGQVYARAFVSVYGVTTSLCAGYVYDEHDVTLGTFVEPGPGGGEGMYLLNPIVNALATGADFIVDLVAPANTIWRVHELKIKYKCSATAGARAIAYIRIDEDGLGMWSWAAQAGTANQDVDVYLNTMLIGERGSVAPVDVALEIQNIAPWIWPEGHGIRIEDTGDISATDAVTVNGVVEEWLVI